MCREHAAAELINPTDTPMTLRSKPTAVQGSPVIDWRASHPCHNRQLLVQIFLSTDPTPNRTRDPSQRWFSLAPARTLAQALVEVISP